MSRGVCARDREQSYRRRSEAQGDDVRFVTRHLQVLPDFEVRTNIVIFRKHGEAPIERNSELPKHSLES